MDFLRTLKSVIKFDDSCVERICKLRFDVSLMVCSDLLLCELLRNHYSFLQVWFSIFPVFTFCSLDVLFNRVDITSDIRHP